MWEALPWEVRLRIGEDLRVQEALLREEQLRIGDDLRVQEAFLREEQLRIEVLEDQEVIDRVGEDL